MRMATPLNIYVTIESGEYTVAREFKRKREINVKEEDDDTNIKKTKSGGDLASERQPKKAKSGDQPHQPSADGPTAEKKWFSVGCAQNDKFYVGPSLERIIKTMSEEIKDKNFNVPTTNSIRLAMSRHKKTSVCLAGIYVQRADILPQGDNVIVIN